ncbi:hypothetical protein [Desulfobacula sp.]|nr:hypothetical protein [Desulfobacula sp.]
MEVKPWEFVADMNSDGVFTISDIIEIFIQLFFFAGRLAFIFDIELFA